MTTLPYIHYHRHVTSFVRFVSRLPKEAYIDIIQVSDTTTPKVTIWFNDEDGIEVGHILLTCDVFYLCMSGAYNLVDSVKKVPQLYIKNLKKPYGTVPIRDLLYDCLKKEITS